MAEPVQDTIAFALVGEETVVNNTVRLSATIESTIRSTSDWATVSSAIRQMMRKFLGDETINWQFSNMERASGHSGMENITVQATARVNESHNHTLEKRARAVSEEGMTITAIHADTTPPIAMIEDAESKLRLRLLTKAVEQLTLINSNFKPPASYRLGDVTFEVTNDQAYANSTRGGMARMSGSTYAYSGNDSDDGTLGNALKLTLRARIVLRKIVDNPVQHG